MASWATFSNKRRSSGENSACKTAELLRPGFSRGGDIALPAAAEDEAAAAALHHLPVNLRPEGHEIIHGRNQREGDHESDGCARDHVNGKNEEAEIPVFPAHREDGGDHGDDLHDHLEFAEIAGLDGEAFGGGDGTEAADHEFTANHDDGHPRRHDLRVELHQGYEGGGDEQLVGERIEEHAHGGDLAAAAREVTINAVGDRGGNENRGGEQLFFAVQAAEAAAGQDPDQHRYAENAAERDVVGQVHRQKLAGVEARPRQLNYAPVNRRKQ